MTKDKTKTQAALDRLSLHCKNYGQFDAGSQKEQDVKTISAALETAGQQDRGDENCYNLGYEISGDILWFGTMKNNGTKVDDIWYSWDMGSYTNEARKKIISRAKILSRTPRQPEKDRVMELMEKQFYNLHNNFIYLCDEEYPKAERDKTESILAEYAKVKGE